LNIGLNAVDPRHHGGWSGELNACEADVEDMVAIADTKGYAVTTRMTKAATRQLVRREISKAARALDAGGIFPLSYPGHGGQLPDRSRDEPDAQDETWCRNWWTPSSTPSSSGSRTESGSWSSRTAGTASR
jgi:metacaspase-1